MTTTYRTFNADSRRWWVVDGPSGSVSLSGIVLPWDTGLRMSITTPDGLRLMPDCIGYHRPAEAADGDDVYDCVVISTKCGGDAGSGSVARSMLRHWETVGWHDDCLRSRLEDLYASRLGGTR